MGGAKMRIAVLGTGVVGRAIGTRLVGLGHEVMMGSRTPDNAGAAEWVGVAGDRASHGTFAAAAAVGELILNCTAGSASLDALALAGTVNLAGKVLIDIANPLDFSKGFPPSLSVCNTDSLAEQVQRAFPETKVVKSLNTMNCEVMVDPSKVPGDHDVFMSGDDPDAKAQVAGLLADFGWKPEQIVDLGGLETARGTEMYLPLWLGLMNAIGTGRFNIKVVR
jgi:predicted dinucleotide-binding enzyme